MDETNNKWLEKIETSDGVKTRSTKEQVAIDFLNKNRKKIPPDRFAKLVNETTEILKRWDLEVQQVQLECAIALNKLKEDTSLQDRTILEKLTAFGTDVVATIDKATSAKDKVIIFRDGKNEAIEIADFEKGLSTKNITEINSTGLANYLIHLQEKNIFTKEKLESVFGANGIGKRKLQDLAIIWGLEDPKVWNVNTNTQKMLAKENPTVLNHIRTILATELKEYLNWPKNIHVKDILKTKYKDSFKEAEFDALTKGEILDIKKLLKYLRQLTGKNITNLQDIDEILTARKQDIREEKRKIWIEEKMYRLDKKNWKTPTEIATEKKLTERKKKVEQLQLESKVTENLKIRAQMADYISWKIDQKKFYQSIDDETKKLEKTEKEKNPQKSEGSKEWAMDKENIIKSQKTEEANDRKMSSSPVKQTLWNALNTMIVWDKKNIPLSKESGATMMCVTKKDENRYCAQIGEHQQIEVSKKVLRGYIGSYRLLENTGLESMIDIPPEKLSAVILACSLWGNRVDNSDGIFWKSERVLFLKTIAWVLGIEEIADSSNINTVRARFKRWLKAKTGEIEPESGFKKLAKNEETGFMLPDGRIDSEKLIAQIKNYQKSIW